MRLLIHSFSRSRKIFLTLKLMEENNGCKNFYNPRDNENRSLLEKDVIQTLPAWFFCTANKAIFTVKLLGNDNVFKILFKPTTKSRVYWKTKGLKPKSSTLTAKFGYKQRTSKLSFYKITAIYTDFGVDLTTLGEIKLSRLYNHWAIYHLFSSSDVTAGL